jgi:hypothetical protein
LEDAHKVIKCKNVMKRQIPFLIAVALAASAALADNTDVTVTTSADGLSTTYTSKDQSSYDSTTSTRTQSADGKTVTYDDTDYTHGWKNATPSSTIYHYAREASAANPTSIVPAAMNRSHVSHATNPDRIAPATVIVQAAITVVSQSDADMQAESNAGAARVKAANEAAAGKVKVAKHHVE